jgi:hypothetical protein
MRDMAASLGGAGRTLSQDESLGGARAIISASLVGAAIWVLIIGSLIATWRMF